MNMKFTEPTTGSLESEKPVVKGSDSYSFERLPGPPTGSLEAERQQSRSAALVDPIRGAAGVPTFSNTDTIWIDGKNVSVNPSTPEVGKVTLGPSYQFPVNGSMSGEMPITGEIKFGDQKVPTTVPPTVAPTKDPSSAVVKPAVANSPEISNTEIGKITLGPKVQFPSDITPVEIQSTGDITTYSSIKVTGAIGTISDASSEAKESETGKVGLGSVVQFPSQEPSPVESVIVGASDFGPIKIPGFTPGKSSFPLPEQESNTLSSDKGVKAVLDNAVKEGQMSKQMATSLANKFKEGKVAEEDVVGVCAVLDANSDPKVRRSLEKAFNAGGLAGFKTAAGSKWEVAVGGAPSKGDPKAENAVLHPSYNKNWEIFAKAEE